MNDVPMPLYFVLIDLASASTYNKYYYFLTRQSLPWQVVSHFSYVEVALGFHVINRMVLFLVTINIP